MPGTPLQAQGRRPFMPQRQAGESFILARSQEWAPRLRHRNRDVDSAATTGEGGEVRSSLFCRIVRLAVSPRRPVPVSVARVARSRRKDRGAREDRNLSVGCRVGSMTLRMSG